VFNDNELLYQLFIKLNYMVLLVQ